MPDTRHVPTAQTRATVREMGGQGRTLDEIAASLGLGRTCLKRHYADELRDRVTPQLADLKPYGFRPGQSGNPSGLPATVREAMQEAQGNAAEMVRVLVRIASDANAPAASRVTAASTVIERAMGKAPATLTLKASLDELGDADLDAAIRAELAQLGVAVSGAAGDAGGETAPDGAEELRPLRH